MNSLTPDRRQIIQALLAISTIGGLSACANEEPSSFRSVSYNDGFFSASEMALIAALCDTIIPQTGTVGAVGAGVPATLQALATDWGDQTFQDYWRGGLVGLSAVLQTEAEIDFDLMSSEDRTSTLSSYDAEVFSGNTDDSFYRDFKATVIEAYYMSEPGASEELAYEPVPGEWIACAPLTDFPKTWAT